MAALYVHAGIFAAAPRRCSFTREGSATFHHYHHHQMKEDTVSANVDAAAFVRRRTFPKHEQSAQAITRAPCCALSAVTAHNFECPVRWWWWQRLVGWMREVYGTRHRGSSSVSGRGLQVTERCEEGKKMTRARRRKVASV